MEGPKLLFINDVPHLSVGDAIALARLAHKRGATAEQYANALTDLLPKAPTPKAKPKQKPKKKKEKKHGR